MYIFKDSINVFKVQKLNNDVCVYVYTYKCIMVNTQLKMYSLVPSVLSYIVLDNEIKKRNSFELEAHNVA